MTEKKDIASRSGFTLLEMIAFIVVAGIFVPLAYIGFSSALKGTADPKNVIEARYIAEKKMEEVTQNEYDSIAETSSDPPYAAEGNYQWKKKVRYVGCSVSGTYPNFTITINEASNVCPPGKTDSANAYKMIEVSVLLKGYEYKVNTIVTKRKPPPE